MNKRAFITVLCTVLLAASAIIALWYKVSVVNKERSPFNDGIEKIDANTIKLYESGVEVDFSEVLLSKQNETRQLIVSEQMGEVNTKLTNKVIEGIDFDILKKTQIITYEGKGFFVVDLDKIAKDDIIYDKEKKQITIKIGHAYLKAIEIDPNRIMVDEVKQGLLTWGSIKLTVEDYNEIEKELKERLESKFGTVENGQQADDIALKMVKEIYEPVIKAIDKNINLVVEFKS